MIYILHGDNKVLSRNLILGQHKKLGSPPRVDIDATQTTPTQLLMELTNGDFFNDKKFYVIDVSELGKDVSLEFMNIFKTVISKKTQNDIVIYAEKTLSKNSVWLELAQCEEVKLIENTVEKSANIFRFVDTVISGNREKTYKELGTLLNEDQDAFYIFSMLIYGLRNITFAKFNTDQFKKMKDFQASKYANYSQNLSEEEFIKLYKRLLELNTQAVTGEIDSKLMVSLSIEELLREHSTAGV